MITTVETRQCSSAVIPVVYLSSSVAVTQAPFDGVSSDVGDELSLVVLDGVRGVTPAIW